MYIQGDSDENVYLLLDVLIDNCKDNKVISLKE